LVFSPQYYWGFSFSAIYGGFFIYLAPPGLSAVFLADYWGVFVLSFLRKVVTPAKARAGIQKGRVYNAHRFMLIRQLTNPLISPFSFVFSLLLSYLIKREQSLSGKSLLNFRLLVINIKKS